MARLPDNEKLILEQAVRWYTWLRDHRADPEQVDVFQRWRAKSTRHRAAFERVDDLWRHCDAIDPLDLPWPTELELQLDRYDGSRPLPLPEGKNPLLDRNGTAGAAAGFVLGEKPAVPRRPRARWQVAAAVGLVAVLVALASPLVVKRPGVSGPALYSTGVAQQRVEQLPDGSTVTLGASTRLSVSFGQTSRRVVLERGEAFFEVARDPSRPFRVEVGNSEVTAVGTAFNINRLRDAVSVSVLEGVVDVSSGAGEDAAAPGKRERLHQGEALVYNRGGGVWQRGGEAVLQRARGWREGRLAFVNEPLERVLQDVNRYSERKIVAGDRSLATLRFTGTIFSNDIDDWLDGLERAFKVRVLEVDGRIVLLKNS